MITMGQKWYLLTELHWRMSSLKNSVQGPCFNLQINFVAADISKNVQKVSCFCSVLIRAVIMPTIMWGNRFQAVFTVGMSLKLYRMHIDTVLCAALVFLAIRGVDVSSMNLYINSALTIFCDMPDQKEVRCLIRCRYLCSVAKYFIHINRWRLNKNIARSCRHISEGRPSIEIIWVPSYILCDSLFNVQWKNVF